MNQARADAACRPLVAAREVTQLRTAIERLQELPQILDTDRFERHAARTEAYLETIHKGQLAAQRRAEELADARRKRLQAENYEQYIALTVGASPVPELVAYALP